VRKNDLKEIKTNLIIHTNQRSEFKLPQKQSGPNIISKNRNEGMPNRKNSYVKIDEELKYKNNLNSDSSNFNSDISTEPVIL
jgi:hypothetical protein